MLDPSQHPLAPVGWSDRVAALYALLERDDLVPARAISVERSSTLVATAAGERTLPIAGVAVGDWLALDGDALAEVLPRWSALGRLDPGGGRQVLATNLDLVLVAAPADRLSSSRVERELVVAWDSGARPVVVVTKLDVAAPNAVAELAERLGLVDVVASSAVAGDGLDDLRALLVQPVTAALLGPSGAGKSTLINALLGEERIAVGSVREEDHRGRHTTTSRHLFALPSGGSLIDMPGLRSLGTDASDEAVAATFPDIDALAAGCRFGDCTHDVEPDCAVADAVATGALDPERLASYRKLVRETAFERRRVDPVGEGRVDQGVEAAGEGAAPTQQGARPMTALVRTAVEKDRGAILSLVRAAFATGGRDGDEEVEVVRATWEASAAPDGLDLVATEDGAAVGHLLCGVGDLAGREAIAIAPLAVAPGHQRQGVGSALVGEALRRADADRWPLVVLLGSPAYYGRFGFEPASSLGIDYLAVGAGNPHFQARRLLAYDPSWRGSFTYCWELVP